MGKNLPHLHPMISLENGNPGCMKGIFHHFNHRKWYHVKKRLSHRRGSGSKPVDVELEADNKLNTTHADHEAHHKNDDSTKSSNHGRSPESGSVHKSSMKSKLKALFAEEVIRRKGRHHRSSSYPTRLPLDRVPSLHRASSAETETSSHSSSSHSIVSSLLDPVLPRICGEPDKTGSTCSLCAARLTKNSLKESDVKIASFQESKIFFDALDLLNIRKELFMKVLQDPTTSLSHQIQNQKASTSKLGLTKSVSFPTPGSSGVGNDINYPHVCSKENIIKQPLVIQDSLDSAAAFGSPKEHKKQHQHVNKLIMKRFKNLREKIRHAMKETKKERQRIVMDGVLHKIPVGYPKNAKEEDSKNDVVAQNWCKYSPVDSILNNDHFSSENRKPDAIRRTASFSEVPLSRYNRLYDLTYNTEANYNQVSDEHVLRTIVSRKKASMSRILSLPDMRSQSFSRLDKWPAISPEMTVKLVEDVDKCILPTMEEDEATEENGFYSLEDSEQAPDVEDEPMEELDLTSYEKEASQFYKDLLIQVGLKNRPDFEYVRDVLEMSGFTGTEILGKWHSDGQPVDPMIYLEVEGGILSQQPDCNHMLLFDLINEVLLEIYGKTFCYWPNLLTSCSRIHPMPVGYHLLEDVWSNINWYLQRIPEIDPSLDDAVSHDLSKADGWMNVQFEAECVAIELEDMMFDDLLDELVFFLNV